MQPFLLVLAGGIIGIFGPILTALLSHRLNRNSEKAERLRAAYIDWSVELSAALEATMQLELNDYLARIPDPHSLQHPSGKSRESLVQEKLTSIAKVRSVRAKLLLMESNTDFLNQMSKLSKLVLNPEKQPEIGNDVQALFRFKKEIGESEESIDSFLRDVERSHPIIRKN